MVNKITRNQLRAIIGDDPRAIKQFENLFNTGDEAAVTAETLYNLTADAIATANAVMGQLAALQATIQSLANNTVNGSNGLNGGGAISTNPVIELDAAITRDLTNNTGELIASSVTLTNGAGAGLGTLTNAPTAGDPTKWVVVDDNGTPRYIPAW